MLGTYIAESHTNSNSQAISRVPSSSSDPISSPTMSGHHDATKPYQPRRGPERVPPQPAADEEESAAAEAEAEAMEQYELPQEHGEEEEEEEGDEGREYYGSEGGAGEAVPMEATAAAAAADAHGAMMLTAAAEAGGVPHVAPNTLTLSFQGEVFVFESVSAEKVQAVLLLLGGRELPPGLGSVPSSSASYSKTLNFPHRMASLMRFREKRKERNFDKKIRYSVRKDVAHRMQRHKGQFTSSKSKAEEVASAVTTSDGSTSWGALEGQPTSASECQQCGISATMTPMMRRGPDGPRTLCNACGLKWANKGLIRDSSKRPTAPLQVVPPATKDSQYGTAEAPIPEQQYLALQAAPAPPPAANGHDS